MKTDPTINQFSARNYWNARLHANWGPQGVGSLAYGFYFNRWLYRMRKYVFRREVDRLGVLNRELRVLDVGCGTGFYIKQWSAMGVKNISGVDIADSSIARLQERYPYFEFYRDDISTLDTNVLGKFDVISAFDILFHIVDDQAYRHALENLHSMLKPGGYLLISDNFLRYEERRHENYWISRTLPAIKTMLLDAGFTIHKRTPVFILMNCPVDTRYPSVTRLWEWLMKPVRQREWLGNLAGMTLYAVDRILVILFKQGPTTEMMICQRHK